MGDVVITADKIKRYVRWIKADRAAEIAPALEASRAIASINTPRRVRHYLAQLAHESAGFTRLIESFAYKDPDRLDDLFRAIRGRDDALMLMRKGPEAIANRVYANRMGNGDEASGDGFRYRGRGFIQLTGKDNYAKAEKMSGLPLLKEPGLLSRAREAAQVAAHFWRWNNINAEADEGDLAGVTRMVNGAAMAGLDDRAVWLKRALVIWPN